MKNVLRQHLEMLQALGIPELYTKKNRQASSKHIPRAVASPSPVIATTPDIDASSSPSFAIKADGLAFYKQEYQACRKCELWHGRKRLVYGEGSPDARCMVIGEGPGEQENLQGRPFVGPAGQLLDKMLLAIKIERQDVYIANVVKCRPPSNRNPEPEERAACLPYLIEQIELIQPRIFLLLGLVAAQTLLHTNLPMHILREQTHTYLGRPAYVTYHPSSLLRNEQWKRPAWEDLQRFQKEYDAL